MFSASVPTVLYAAVPERTRCVGTIHIPLANGQTAIDQSRTLRQTYADGTIGVSAVGLSLRLDASTCS